MGHRTLVAYDRAGYDLHHARGDVTPDDVTPETPFGGRPDGDGGGRPASGGIGDSSSGDGRLTDDRRTVIEPDPVATGLTFPALCSFVDPVEHEALLVVGDDFAVRTYLVVALGGDGTDGPGGGSGGPTRATAALVGYDDPADAAYLEGWLAGARTVRDDVEASGDALVRALRSLDPDRGTLLWLADGATSRGGDGGRDLCPLGRPPGEALDR